jgi:hypothetical protein
MGGVGLGDDEPLRGGRLAHRSVGETLLAAVIFAVAMGFTWVNQGGDDPLELAAPSAQRAGTSQSGAPTTIPPSQPAIAVSFTTSGEIIRPAPVRARIVDPQTGQEVLVELPPGSRVVDGDVVPIGSTGTSSPGSTATTSPGTGTTGTTDGGSPITQPPTTEPPTTEPPTTEPPTTGPPTTEPPTTEPPTTAPLTTEAPLGIVGGLLGWTRRGRTGMAWALGA